MYYPEYDKLFGAPIKYVPKPEIPFKLKTWHYVAIGSIIILAGYGSYSAYQNINYRFKVKKFSA